MNMNIDDPKLTAFALDELDEPEKSTIAREVAESPEAQRAVDETRELARALKNEFAAEMANEKPIAATARRNLSDIRDDPWFWGIGRPPAVRRAGPGRTREAGVRKLPEGQAPELCSRPPSRHVNTASAHHMVEHPLLEPQSNPLSTFTIDVDTASYSNSRLFVNERS